MDRQVENIYTEAADIERFKALVQQLPANARVALWLSDGSQCEGVVAARPTLQTLRDAQANEGCNALLTLEHPDMAGWTRGLWLDQVTRVVHLDSTLGSES